ncbi:MAG: DUF2461 domain-containing protein [Crocinitomicaceae bacterium]|nr:DUF2461 domain-containing protein [Crocinitomicaceae bacterium]
MASISKDNIQFLIKLSKNNDRDWFQENKAEYVKQHEGMISFADDLLEKMNAHDNIETLTGKKSLHRIYRDVRFSKDKSPYKTHWGGSFKRATKQLRGGYYFHIQPGGNSFIGGGFWGPNKEDLLRVREEITTDASEMRKIITSKDFVGTFGVLKGEQLKSAPKGFDKEHKDIDLLRYKQFIFGKNFTDEEILADDFAQVANDTFKKMRPFFDLMSEILTTDSNGTPLD